MGNTKINLDRQSEGRVLALGTTSASGEALLTLNKGTAAASTVVLDVKGSQNIAGDLNLTGNLNITGAINETTVNNLNVTDRVIRVNDGATTPSDDTSGLEVEGTSDTKIGAIYYKSGSATKFSVGDGSSQVDIVGTSSTQTLTNKTIGGGQISGNISGNAANVTGTVAVANGGTGVASLTAYGVVIGGTTSTGAVQSVAVGTSGHVLTSNGAGAAPTFQALSSSTYQRSTAVSGTQNDSNKTFTIANAVSAGSEQVFLNGQLLNPGSGNDYVISGTTVTFQAAMTAPSASDVIRVYGTY